MSHSIGDIDIESEDLIGWTSGASSSESAMTAEETIGALLVKAQIMQIIRNIIQTPNTPQIETS